MQPKIAVRVKTHEFACLAGRGIAGEDPMIKRSLEFDAVHRVENPRRAYFVDVLVPPLSLLQRIRTLAAGEFA
jgi:hypothetical protein